eukprot:scaffold100700_cov27-Phaeocystis_antarctica.AAC.1
MHSRLQPHATRLQPHAARLQPYVLGWLQPYVLCVAGARAGRAARPGGANPNPNPYPNPNPNQ